MTTAVAAFYFDGKTSRRHAVTLEVIDGMARIYSSPDTYGEAAPVERVCPITQLRVSERLSRAARKVTYPDGAYLEIQDHAAFAVYWRAPAIATRWWCACSRTGVRRWRLRQH